MQSSPFVRDRKEKEGGEDSDWEFGRKMEDGEQQQSEKEPGNEVRPIKSLLRNGNGCGRRDEWL
jgi:hypothetical protein